MKADYEHPNGNGTQHFDWTDGGMRLLEIIKNKIKQYGGEWRLYGEMIKETRPILTMPNVSVPQSEMSVILNNYKKATLKDLQKMTGRSRNTIRAINKKLGIKKVQAHSYAEGKKTYICKIVLNTETGIYYDSVWQAALSSPYPRRTLENYVNGYRKNKSAFILV